MRTGQDSEDVYLRKKLSELSPRSKEGLLDDLKYELEWTRKNRRIQFFTPNGKQEEFVKIAQDTSGLVSILSSANGVGKTADIVNIFGNLIFGPQSHWFDTELFRNWPYPKRIRYITNPKLVEEIGPFHSEIEKWWPKGKYEVHKAGKNYFSQYKANGWVVDVMTYDQDVSQFEGGNLGLVVCDEPPPRGIYHACITRLRMGGLLFVLMTPLTEAAWFFEEVVPRNESRIVYASMEDACKEHGIRGHLDHNQIMKMVEEMDPDEIEARVHGKAMYLKGLIYKVFDYNVHVAKENIPVPWDAPIYHIVDPHTDKPFAMIWGYPDKQGVFRQVDEWPNEDFYRMHGCSFGIEDYKKIILMKEEGWNVQKRIIDRHFADIESVQTRTTIRQEFGKVGLRFNPSYKASEEVDTGIIKVRSALRYNTKKPIDSANQPKYIVSPKCKNTIKGFQRWSFDPKTGKIREEYKDFMDCVRYGLMDSPRLEEPIPDNQPRKLYG